MADRDKYPQKVYCYGVEDGLDGFCVHALGCKHEGKSWSGPNSDCIQPQDAMDNNVLGFVLEMFGEGKARYEPTANVRQMAASNWEMYQAHVQQGFSSDQAMQIICKILEVALIAGMSQDEGDNP